MTWMPHGMCFAWDPVILIGRVISDGMIALSYFCIPVGLMMFKARRPDLKLNIFWWLFSFFITSCGLTHVMDIVTIWMPSYRLDLAVRIATGLVSAFTAAGLFVVIPKLRRWHLSEVKEEARKP